MASSLISLATDSSNNVYQTVDVDRWFAAACTAGDTVIEDTATTTTSTGQALSAGQAAKKATASSDLATVVGGLVATVVAGSWGKIRVAGIQTGVACKSTVAAGDALKSSTDAAGRLDTAANTDINVVATALTSAVSNTCTVNWHRR